MRCSFLFLELLIEKIFAEVRNILKVFGGWPSVIELDFDSAFELGDSLVVIVDVGFFLTENFVGKRCELSGFDSL